MTGRDRAAALASYLRSRTEMEGPGMFVPSGEREAFIARVRSLGAAAAAPKSAPGAVPSQQSGLEAGGAAAPEGAASAALGVPSDPVSAALLARLSASGTADEIEALADLDVVRAVAKSCVRCPLHASRRTVVFADGSPDARVMCVGEAPGAREDETGLPFVGRAGQLLDQLLLSVGLPRRDVYICNVLKCRPPQNRNPQDDEIERCSPFLRRQVALVKPEVVIAFGTFAARTLLGVRESLGRLRGRAHLFQGVPLVATYHPAALLRNPNWTRATWEDLQRVRRLLEEGGRG